MAQNTVMLLYAVMYVWLKNCNMSEMTKNCSENCQLKR